MSTLRADVYVAAPTPFLNPNGKPGGNWSPISSTLIHGEKEAVLVDTPITLAQTEELCNWIEKTIPNKKLTAIYITHGHADHFLGIPTVIKRFSGARALATSATIEHMKQQFEPAYFETVWESFFPGQIDRSHQLADPLPANNEFLLEGHVLRAVEVGMADTHDSTVLWVPDLKLAVCGDVVYGDVHQMLGEANTREKRAAWIVSIGKVEALMPEMVVPGHKRASELDGTYHLAESRKYIEVFQKFLDDGVKDGSELMQLMLKAFPTRYNPAAVRMSCVNAFPKPVESNKL